ncbi:MAG: hypothetical protein NZM31_05945 [Gemmatales bacterium]|nr:hypothetical protein [Gemmatales bacterium]MDW8386540.1 hypothetical protein [Gemmatales bacterium]
MEASRPAFPSPNAAPVVLDKQTLLQEGKRLRALAAQQLRQIDEAIRELRRGHDDLQKEREAFHRQQEDIRRRWEKRWHQEWQRLHDREAEIEKTKAVALAECRRINTDLELQRRQLEAAWQELRQAEACWQQRRAAEMAELAAERQQLAQQFSHWKQTEDALRHQAALHESLIRTYRQEISHLESRIRNFRGKLESLREEAALVEAGLCPVGQVRAEPPSSDFKSPAPATNHLAIPWHQLLNELAESALALLDESQRLIETQERMAAVKSAWESDWQRALEVMQETQARLRQQEESLRHRENAVLVREQEASRRLAECRGLEHELQTREIQLAYQRSKLACRQARWQDDLRSRRAVLRDRFVLAHRLREQWRQLLATETQRLLRLRTGCEQARLEYLTAREMLRQKERELDAREQHLLQRELILAQASLQSDANPIPQGTFHEMIAAWERAILKQQQATQRREVELSRRAKRLERLRSHLMEERRVLETLRHEALTAQAEADEQRSRYQAEAEQLQEQLNRLRTDRDHLLERLRQQEEHLEHLTLHLLDSTQEPPALSAAA